MLEQEQQTREKFNVLKKYYDETWDATAHTLHVGYFGSGAKTLLNAYADATAMLVGRLNAIQPIAETSTILDVGCGTGRTLMEICATYGCSGVGIDISDEQINDAKDVLSKTNDERAGKGLLPLNISFIQGSGSELDTILPEHEQFSHVISQDALMLVVNKQSLFENIYRVLKPGGALAIADFLSEKSKEQFTEKEQQLIYNLVNWSKELSFETYTNILQSVGFTIVQSEERGQDMMETYSRLAKDLAPYVEKDTVYADLAKRYAHIVSAVSEKKMGWGLFFAVKK